MGRGRELVETQGDETVLGSVTGSTSRGFGGQRSFTVAGLTVCSPSCCATGGCSLASTPETDDATSLYRENGVGCPKPP